MRIIFTNSKENNFEISGNYILSPNWSGFGEVEVQHQRTRAPYQDGETYIDTLLNTRVMTIEFTILGVNRQEVFDRRRLVAEHFNPKLGIGTLKWIQEGKEFWIECIPDTPIFASGDGQSKNHQAVIIQFHAFNPYWYDPNQIQKVMVGFSGGWSYPWSYPISYGQIGTQLTINNVGYETPVQIYFYGEVENPKIKNLTTNQEISIVKKIYDSEILIINTAFGEKSVTILSGGEYINAFEYVDPDSEFWNLIPGENILNYTATSEGENAECRVLYYYRYSGV